MLLNVIKAATYLAFMGYTLRKYSASIVKLNKFLMWSWTVEVIARLVLAFLDYYNVDYTTVVIFIWTALTQINFIIFLIVIFRLKALHIYMDVANKTEIDIKQKLKRLKIIRGVYITLYALIVMSQSVVAFASGSEIMSSSAYAWYYLIASLSALGVFVSVDIYLICTAI